MSEADKIIENLRKSGRKVEEFYTGNKTSDKNVGNDSVIAHKFAVMQQQLEQKDKRIKELEEEKKALHEYLSIALNLDEMTATKYINIQREAYIRGRAEEQQKAEQIIYENYIPKQDVIDEINKYNEKIEKYNEYSKQGKETDVEYYENITNTAIVQVLQELLEGESK